MILAIIALASFKDRFTVSLSDGGRVQLVAVTNSGFEKSWKPDGTPIKIDRSKLLVLNFGQLPEGRMLLFNVFPPRQKRPSSYSPLLTRVGDGNGIIFPADDDPNQWQGLRQFSLPAGAKTTDFVFNASTSNWKRAASASFNPSKPTAGGVFGSRLELFKGTLNAFDYKDKKGVSHFKKTGEEDQVMVGFRLPKSVRKEDFTFEALDSKGNRLRGAGYQLPPDGAGKACFLGKPSSVSTVRLLVCPVEKITFRSVVVQP